MGIDVHGLRPEDRERIGRINEYAAKSVAFYTRQSTTGRWGYASLNMLAIVFGTAVPVVALVPAFLRHQEPGTTAIVSALAGIFGAVATLFRSTESLFKFRDTWLRNANMIGRLESERFLFETHAPPYDAGSGEITDLIAKYAARVDAVIASDYQQWSETVLKPTTGST